MIKKFLLTLCFISTSGHAALPGPSKNEIRMLKKEQQRIVLEMRELRSRKERSCPSEGSSISSSGSSGEDGATYTQLRNLRDRLGLTIAQRKELYVAAHGESALN